jgi:hypothetical protein
MRKSKYWFLNMIFGNLRNLYWQKENLNTNDIILLDKRKYLLLYDYFLIIKTNFISDKLWINILVIIFY